jgi:hypothetical protein
MNCTDWLTSSIWPTLDLDNEFSQPLSVDQGAPTLSTRLIARLHYLKHAFACPDEAVVERWVENPFGSSCAAKNPFGTNRLAIPVVQPYR